MVYALLADYSKEFNLQYRSRVIEFVGARE